MTGTSRHVRLLTAVPICDGHDSAVNTINLECVRHGLEIVYLGYHRSARAIVRAAVQEDVRAVGISSYNGGHVEFFGEVARLLKVQGASDIGVFGGGGGTITPGDVARMRRLGVGEIFFAGTPLAEIVAAIQRTYGGPEMPNAERRMPNEEDGTSGAESDQAGCHAHAGRFGVGMSSGADSDRLIARRITWAAGFARATRGRGDAGTRRGKQSLSPRLRVPVSPRPLPRLVLGVTGPGGAGKTTLIDELVRAFLAANPQARLAVLCHDPILTGHGALLGDRATMIHAQDDRVFLRSLAASGANGLARATASTLAVLTHTRAHPDGRGFDLILVETTGIGQGDQPFRRGLVDRVIYVTSPDYGSRLQLQKIALLDRADVVVVNKTDLPGAQTAAAELALRLEANGRGQSLVLTQAKRHRDVGVEELLRWILGEASGPKKKG